jgi:hypothetical protein
MPFFMRGRLLLIAAMAICSSIVAVSPSGASSTSQSAWAAQANKVCVVWLAKAKKEFGSPITPAQLYSFAVKAKALETSELADLQKIPGQNDAGAAALAAMKVDIAEVGSSITAWNKGNASLFVTILKRYLNDKRPKSAFAVAGANQCG